VRPTGENLTLTSGRSGPELMSASIYERHDPGARTLELKREPVGDELRACVPLERRKRPVDR
jgi:hypothetical protein